jgi:drug/metabolite transporter (DMT)-like permease
MFWVILAGIGACTNAAYYIANKKFLQRMDPHILAATGFLCTSGILLGISLVQGIPSVGPQFLLAVLATTLLNILGTVLTFRALASTDISLAIPMLSFTPLFLVGTAALILHEIPSAVGMAGIVIIVAGSYILNTADEDESITDPFRAMVSHPGVLSMLVVAFIYAIAINFDKMVVQNSDAVFGSGIVFLLLGSAFVLIHRVSLWRLNDTFPQPVSSGTPVLPANLPVFRWRDVIGAGLFIGIIITIEAVVINTAYTQQIVPYVIAIKRMSIILIVVYGAFVFREKEVIRRLFGAVLMLAGAVLILLFP